MQGRAGKLSTRLPMLAGRRASLTGRSSQIAAAYYMSFTITTEKVTRVQWNQSWGLPLIGVNQGTKCQILTTSGSKFLHLAPQLHVWCRAETRPQLKGRELTKRRKGPSPSRTVPVSTKHRPRRAENKTAAGRDLAESRSAMVSLPTSADVAIPCCSIAGNITVAISATARSHSLALTASPIIVRMCIVGGGKPAAEKARCSRAPVLVILAPVRSKMSMIQRQQRS